MRQHIDSEQLTCVCLEADCIHISSVLSVLIEQYNLPLTCNWYQVGKLNNKTLKQLNIAHPAQFRQACIIVERDEFDTLVATLHHTPEDNSTQSMKVRLDWHKMQRRVVTAGKKSELLLQACKLSIDSKVIDCTAGFGHDSLILASTLSADTATVMMIEKNPTMALLLLLEKQRMQVKKNWQVLMGRLDIYHADVLDIPSELQEKLGTADIVYLDPMFPHESYEGAKVGKGMQVLHQLVTPPQLAEEQALLRIAGSLVNDTGRVVVKRPKNAPYLAKHVTNESWENDAVRFDAYLDNSLLGKS